MSGHLHFHLIRKLTPCLAGCVCVCGEQTLNFELELVVILLYYIILYYIMLYYTTLYYIILYCIILYYIMLYYIILCYIYR